VNRFVGIAIRSVATYATHRAPCAVLISRPAPTFPGRILLADDGQEVSDAAVRVAAAIAAQHGSEVIMARPAMPDAAMRERLHRNAVLVRSETGREHTLMPVGEQPSRSILGLAREFACGLIVMGSARKTGLRSAASVSEVVAHIAPCSVLIVPVVEDEATDDDVDLERA
jgi:nucleotide-binding universal stress UspA family protein